MKLIIDIPDGCYEELKTASFPVQEAYRLVSWIKDGTPLDEVMAKIAEEKCLTDNPYTNETKYTVEHLKLLEIFDNISKAESEG